MKKLLSPTNYTDSWQLTKESFQFLSQNRDLNFLPLLGLVSAIAVIILALGLFPDKASLFNSKSAYGLLICLFLLLSFVAVYLNTVFIAIALKRLNNEPASITYGLRIANQRFPFMLKWAFMVSTIGLIAKICEGPQNIIEKIFGYSIGYHWSTAAYFVLPILVMENVSVFKAMQSSAEAVGRGWRNTVSVKAFITIFFVFVLLLMSEFTGYPNQTLHLIFLTAPVFLIVYILGSTLESIIVSALYINVVQQKEPKFFDVSVLGRAFIKEED